MYDLRSGEFRSTITRPEAAADEIAFVRIEADGAVPLGGRSAVLASEFPVETSSVDMHFFYVAAYECTQAQWRLICDLAGMPEAAEPWSAYPETVIARGDDRAAAGVSLDLVQEVLAAYNDRVRGWSDLALPSDVQWEVAGRAGAVGTDLNFGDFQRDAEGLVMPPTGASMRRHAHVAESNDGEIGPFAVGQLEPTAADVLDLHGNVWEITSDAHLRGGSWRDPCIQATLANRVTVVADQPHPLAGIRFVMDF
ncbi:MAG: formylglycine-generating enzyme family protein [Planctomycetota bacterium]